MYNFRSPLVLYGSEPPSKGTNLKFRQAAIDSGADARIWNLKDAMKLFSILQISKLEVIGVNGATTRTDRQGTFVVCLKGPQGTEYNLDLGTVRAMESFPVNMLSLSRLVDIGAVLYFENNEYWMQPPARF